MGENKKMLGIVSALGTYVAMVLVAWKTGVFPGVISELASFVSGGVLGIAESRGTFLMMLPVILAVVALELLCSIGSSMIAQAVLGNGGKHAVSESFTKMQSGHNFFRFFVLTLCEEVVTRWLFLGVLTKIPFLSGTAAFYLLFLVGNGLWALVHLSNFKDKKDQSVLRVLPQFVGGIFLTYVFVKYGLLGAIIAHFASNAAIFAMSKVQRVSVVDVLIVGYAAMCAFVSYRWMEKPLEDIAPWFLDNPVFVLGGWGFWDYMKVSVFLSSCTTMLFGGLCYDRSDVSKKNEGLKQASLATYLVALAVIIPMMIGFLYLVYALLGFFVTSAPLRIIVLGIILSFAQKDASPSAIARTFWSGVLGSYTTICVLQALGFWWAIPWMAVGMVINAPMTILERLDD